MLVTNLAYIYSFWSVPKQNVYFPNLLKDVLTVSMDPQVPSFPIARRSSNDSTTEEGVTEVSSGSQYAKTWAWRIRKKLPSLLGWWHWNGRNPCWFQHLREFFKIYHFTNKPLTFLVIQRWTDPQSQACWGLFIVRGKGLLNTSFATACGSVSC